MLEQPDKYGAKGCMRAEVLSKGAPAAQPSTFQTRDAKNSVKFEGKAPGATMWAGVCWPGTRHAVLPGPWGSR